MHFGDSIADCCLDCADQNCNLRHDRSVLSWVTLVSYISWMRRKGQIYDSSSLLPLQGDVQPPSTGTHNSVRYGD
jgi:hypothetical protein